MGSQVRGCAHQYRSRSLNLLRWLIYLIDLVVDNLLSCRDWILSAVVVVFKLVDLCVGASICVGVGFYLYLYL